MSKELTATGLFGFFALAYLITPYYTIVQQPAMQLVFSTVTLAIGVAWAILSSSAITISAPLLPRQALWLLPLFAGFLLLNFNALHEVLPWRSDEAHHVLINSQFVRNMNWYWAWVILLVMLIGFYLFFTRLQLFQIILATSLLASIVVFIAVYTPVNQHQIFLRYPFISRYFQLSIPLIMKSFDITVGEAGFRLFSVILFLFVAWFSTYPLRKNTALRLFATIAIATLPMVLFFASTYFLEFMAVLLMAVVAVFAGKLLKDDFAKLKQHPAWIALLFIGFMKETTIFFLLIFLGTRFLFKVPDIFTRKAIYFKKLKDEIIIGILTVTPWVVYIFYRKTFASTRSFSPDFDVLLQPKIYLTILRELSLQTGFFLLLFIGGIILLFRNKQAVVATFYLSVALGYSFIHAIDFHGLFAGYARFNLFILPVFLSSGVFLIRHIKPVAAFTALGVTFALNIVLLPLNPDGTKPVGWGRSGYEYPDYQAAYKWIVANKPYDKVAYIQRKSGNPYPYQFYYNLLQWFPQDTTCLQLPQNQMQFDEEFARLTQQKYQIIFYTPNIKEPAIYESPDNQFERKIFENQESRIAIYYYSGQ